jgi:hypothetical protein
VRRADNLTTISADCLEISWNPQGFSRPVMGLLLLFTSLVRVESSHQAYAEPRIGWLPDHLPSHKTYVLNFVL